MREALAPPAACQALQARYPAYKGKTFVNAINPHTPGYEALDPNDPSKYVGFDIDLGETIGACLGFSVTYKSVAFASLMTTMASGQADIVISDIYATKERAKAADFITYSKVFDGVLVAKGNPKKLTGINASMCGATAQRIPDSSKCRWCRTSRRSARAAGKPEPGLQLYDNNAQCIQAILAGRADTYVNDVNTVDQAVKAYPDKLEKATAVTLPYSVGIAVPRWQARVPRRGAGGAARDPEGRHRDDAAQEVGSGRRRARGAEDHLREIARRWTCSSTTSACLICSKASTSR